jgi:hypothetical protein
MGEWPEKVFKYSSGKMREVAIDDFPAVKKSYLPPMPKSRPRYGDVVTQKNKTLAKQKPWVRGLYEGVIAADLILKQNLEQRNRIALIVLDSTLEIAFKEYLVNETGPRISNKRLAELFSNRHTVHSEVRKHVPLTPVLWQKIDYYYDQRSKLVHDRATATIPENEIWDFRSVVETVLTTLYKLKFK